MKLFSWNVNGLRAVINKGNFEPFIQTFQPDILCLQETKLQPDQLKLDLAGYQQIWNSALKKGYSGTAIFSKTAPLRVTQNLPDELIKKYQLTPDSYGDPNNEGRVLTVEYKEFFLVNVYTPNSKSDLSRLDLRSERWDPAFLEYLLILQQQKPVIFCGDLNVAHQEIDLKNPKPNIGKHGFTDEERSGFQAFLDAGFIDTFRQQHPQQTDAYTWWTHWANARARNVGWRIDYFLVHQSLAKKIQQTAIHPAVMGSDHCPISLEIAINE